MEMIFTEHPKPDQFQCGATFFVGTNAKQCHQFTNTVVTIPKGILFLNGKVEWARGVESTISICQNCRARLEVGFMDLLNNKNTLAKAKNLAYIDN